MIANTSSFVPVAPQGVAEPILEIPERKGGRGPYPAASPASISVWSIRLEGLRCGRPGANDCFVTREEAERAARFRRPDDRRRYLVCRRVVRSLLARRLGEAPHRLAIGTAPGGKPFLVDHADLHFNLSHTTELAVVAIAEGTEVGVDIERVDEAFPVMATAREFFRPDEASMLGDLELSDRARHFFRLWCAREAALKAVGSGFCEADPADVEVDLEAGTAVLHHLGDEPVSFRLLEMDLGGDHVGVVAHRGAADAAVENHHWREPHG